MQGIFFSDPPVRIFHEINHFFPQVCVPQPPPPCIYRRRGRSESASLIWVCDMKFLQFKESRMLFSEISRSCRFSPWQFFFSVFFFFYSGVVIIFRVIFRRIRVVYFFQPPLRYGVSLFRFAAPLTLKMALHTKIYYVMIDERFYFVKCSSTPDTYLHSLPRCLLLSEFLIIRLIFEWLRSFVVGALIGHACYIILFSHWILSCI